LSIPVTVLARAPPANRAAMSIFNKCMLTKVIGASECVAIEERDEVVDWPGDC
jgi:hypothetical protein